MLKRTAASASAAAAAAAASTASGRATKRAALEIPRPSECPLCGSADSSLFFDRVYRSGERRVFWKCPQCRLVHVHRDHWPTPEEEKARYDTHNVRHSSLSQSHQPRRQHLPCVASQNDPKDERYREFLMAGARAAADCVRRIAAQESDPEPSASSASTVADTAASSTAATSDGKSAASSSSSSSSSSSTAAAAAATTTTTTTAAAGHSSDGSVQKQPRPIRLLDFGCGPGPVIHELVHSLLPESLRQRVSWILYDPVYRHEPSSLEEGAFDVITCTEVAEHFRRPREELERLQSLLRPGGGRLVLQTSFVVPLERFDRWAYQRDPTHLVFYSEESLRWACCHAPRSELELELLSPPNVAVIRRSIPPVVPS
jgi:hypothetical protein